MNKRRRFKAKRRRRETKLKRLRGTWPLVVRHVDCDCMSCLPWTY